MIGTSRAHACLHLAKPSKRTKLRLADLQRDLEQAVNTITAQIQGLLAISEPAVLAAQEAS
jgi:hypothetical protein